MTSAFKTLFTDMVNAGGDPQKQNKDLTKQMLKVFVKETQPFFLVSDSYFYVPAYFTQSALDEFNKRFPTVKLQDLNEKVILITQWSLELKKVDSNAVFTSYASLEVRLILHAFKPQFGEKLHPTRWPTNLYRDDEFKTCIQYFRHRVRQEVLAKMPATDVPLFSKGDVTQGIILSKTDDWQFKEGTTKIVSIGVQPKKGVVALLQPSAAKVKGGAQNKKVSKAQVKASIKKEAEKEIVTKTIDKVLKFNPGKKSTGSAKGKKSVPTAKKASPAPGKKSAVGTTDEMTMQTLKKILQFQKGGKKEKVGEPGLLGKRSTGKKSAK